MEVRVHSHSKDFLAAIDFSSIAGMMPLSMPQVSLAHGIANQQRMESAISGACSMGQVELVTPTPLQLVIGVLVFAFD